MIKSSSTTRLNCAHLCIFFYSAHHHPITFFSKTTDMIRHLYGCVLETEVASQSYY